MPPPAAEPIDDIGKKGDHEHEKVMDCVAICREKSPFLATIQRISFGVWRRAIRFWWRNKKKGGNWHWPGLMQDMPQTPSHRHFFLGERQSSSATHFRKQLRPFFKRQERKLKMSFIFPWAMIIAKWKLLVSVRGLHPLGKNRMERCVDSWTTKTIWKLVAGRVIRCECDRSSWQMNANRHHLHRHPLLRLFVAILLLLPPPHRRRYTTAYSQ